MIVTKQRKSLQPSSPYTRGERYRYANDDEGLLRDYRVESQSVPINYAHRQRNSISTVSPIGKGGQNCFNSYSKKTDKKYDYSMNLDESLENQHLNRTNDQINQKYRYEPGPSGQTFKVDFILEDYERKRIASVNQSSSKYHSTESKSRPILMPSEQKQAKSSLPEQKIELKNYLKNFERQYDSASKPQQKKTSFTAGKENGSLGRKPFEESLGRKPLMSQKFMEDNFGATDKFKEFKNLNRSNQYQDPKTKSKYQPKYAGMRTQKRYQITKEEPQKQRTSMKKDSKENHFTQTPIDVAKLLKDSNSQNIQITEKINRIQKLNQQINKRLQGMLHRNMAS